MDDNGQKMDLEKQFKYHIKLYMNDDGSFACNTNVGSLVLGYGMLKLGERGVETHIMRLKEKAQPKGGIMNFVRGKR